MFHMEQKHFDLLVLGGGHAGLEAAWIASDLGLNVGLVTLPGVLLASAPCNPAIGGVGKGQVAREIDVLGGLMGKLADLAGIQYRALNSSKGYAVRSTRVQIDKAIYPKLAEEFIQKKEGISVLRDKIIHISQDKSGFFLQGQKWSYRGKKLIVTAGTFLGGVCHTGSSTRSEGRIGQETSAGLNQLLDQVESLPVRFKTGTPPRLKNSSLNYQKMHEQPSDATVRNFHFLHQPFERFSSQVSCYMTYTNTNTLKKIREKKELSPLFNGQIRAVGARYCPSIEDKAFRYPDRDIHHIFIEPEGLELESMYPNGISTSLPLEVQREFLQTIEGLEEAEILTPGYAVEYDVVNTTKLNLSLEYSDVPGLYFAGQVNGTSGYEEAAGQGLIAGINAAFSLLQKPPFILNRHESYIGVMVEDLISNQRDEPYRLFTARSEDRLYLREDNTALRMLPYRQSLGLANPLDTALKVYSNEVACLRSLCKKTFYKPGFHTEHFIEYHYGELKEKVSLAELLIRVERPVETLQRELQFFGLDFSFDALQTVAIELIYRGYQKRAEEQNRKVYRLEKAKIRWNQWVDSPLIAFECRERIRKIQPETFGQLKRIEGIRPATLSLIASQV